ncbi:MAG: TerB family tellurite resistance protein [Campylobacterales bacterium]|nr:TerB family tellurite resistance protein [Campylobacterales bacterium]
MTQLIIFAVLLYIFYRVYKSYQRFNKLYYTKKGFEHFTLTKEALHSSELGLFVALMAKVAKADGRVHELEAELIGNTLSDIAKVFPDPEAAKTHLKAIFNEEKERPNTIDNIASSLYVLIRKDAQKSHMMMMYLINLAFVDGHLSSEEERLLLKIAAFLHVSQNELDAMMARFAQMFRHATTQSSIDEAYALLHVKPEDSMETIKKAYRKAVKESHPDLMKAQGKSDDYIAEATRKIQEINAAYELITKARG